MTRAELRDLLQREQDRLEHERLLRAASDREIALLREQREQDAEHRRLLLEQLARQTALIESLTRATTEQTAAIERLQAELARYQRKVHGKKSEKMPSPQPKPSAAASKAAGEDKRKKNKASRDDNAEVTRPLVSVPEAQRTCPHCRCSDLIAKRPVDAPRLIEFVPPSFVYEDAVLERLTCPCGKYEVTAEPQGRVFDKSPYGPRLIAHLIVTKLLDALPHHRLQKILGRQDVPLARQTMTDLLHRAAEILEPLVARMLALIVAQPIVQADETSQRRQDSDKLAFVWTFLANVEERPLIAFEFASDRSGDTPERVLGDSTGFLLVDMYSGYNTVTTPRRRRRCGCWAHVRRKFWELRDRFAEADELLAHVSELYRVEHEAAEAGIVGTPAHLAKRLRESIPTLFAIRAWVRHHRLRHPPRSAIGQALGYVWRNFRALMSFLRDPRIRLDNNRSESALRPVAMGRNNYLFVGHEKAGKNIAVLLSLVASAAANGLNAEEYVADVLKRVSTHPASKIDDLLPHRWSPAA